jgi:hypothetical protein
MADRRKRGLAVAVVAAAGLMLPATASASLSPWLVGASYNGPTTREVQAPSTAVVIRHEGRIGRALACDGTVALTLTQGGRVLQRRTVRLDRRCRFQATFRVARADAADLLVTRRYRGRTTSVRVAPWLGGRGVDQGLQAPEALDLY